MIAYTLSLAAFFAVLAIGLGAYREVRLFRYYSHKSKPMKIVNFVIGLSLKAASWLVFISLISFIVSISK